MKPTGSSTVVDHFKDPETGGLFYSGSFCYGVHLVFFHFLRVIQVALPRSDEKYFASSPSVCAGSKTKIYSRRASSTPC